MWTFALLSFVGCQNQELPEKDFKIETAVFRMDIKRPEWFLPMINTLVHISSGNLKIEPLVAIFDTTIGKSLPKMEMDGPVRRLCGLSCRWQCRFCEECPLGDLMLCLGRIGKQVRYCSVAGFSTCLNSLGMGDRTSFCKKELGY